MDCGDLLGLRGLLEPRGVAVVGASSNLESISGRPLKLLMRYRYQGGIYPVNPNRESIGGLRCYRDLLEVDGPVDVALVAVRANLVPQVIRQCSQRGIGFAVVFSSGFAEGGDQALQEEVIREAEAGGVRVLGPNCQGLVNLAKGIPLSFSASLDTDRFTGGSPGGIAYVSQSGAFGFASFACASDMGARFRYVVTTGNQGDLDTVEVSRALLEDPEVRMLMMYLEGVRDSERLVELLKAARGKGVPVGILKAGRSASGSEAAKSHTASVAGDQRVWRAVLEQHGAILLEDLEDISSLGLMCGAPRPRGSRVGIVTTSGGAGIMMADLCSERGLAVPKLNPNAAERISRVIPPFGSPVNPVDVTAQVINDPLGLKECLEAVRDSGDVDMISVVISMITGEAGLKTAQQVAEFAKTCDMPLLCSWLIDQEHGGEFIELLRENHVPVLRSLRQSAWTLKALCDSSSSLDLGSSGSLAPFRVPEGLMGGVLTEHEAKGVLKAAGVPVTREELAVTLEDALRSAERIGYPVALKVMSREIPHKTDAGVVALGVRGAEELKEAYRTVMARALEVPGAKIEGVLVQEMVKGLECIVGVKRDPVFGPVVAFGLGGVFVEVLGDLAIRKAPVFVDEALEMVDSIKASPLLGRFRGRGALDKRALAEAISAISRLALDERVLELDVNPLFVMEEGKGVVCGDALINLGE
ncbi:acyl-CoA synthetase (NDP forming) [Thermanaerovibrio velox DSM 12556]|uniref:Acyl-CoA synthetase (NDP forming) n=1 Tax=Thermanaerovibrio velox DSM 12556 TaxID=926567 RepID=H0UPA4_9BACT|nr:acetate--CoA ligase family protein [Thermanaerovibrio velox]EHM09517.1 acyl-CoA synthetase (NDP forming) [Thermanaerovibrio velox DSM 12556]